MEFKHIVEPEPEPAEVYYPGRPVNESPSALSPADWAKADGARRKRLRDNLPLTRGAICLSAIVLIGAGVFEWVGVGPAIAAVGVAILYAQGTRFIR